MNPAAARSLWFIVSSGKECVAQSDRATYTHSQYWSVSGKAEASGLAVSMDAGADTDSTGKAIS